MTRIYSFLICIVFIILVPEELSAQRGGRPSTIRGVVTGADGEKLEFADVYLKNSSVGTVTDKDGKYHLRVPAGRSVLVAQMLGYETAEIEIEIRPDEHRDVGFQLRNGNYQLDKIEVVASSVRQINRTAYNVVAIDAKLLHNSSLNVANALDRISGVKIKETGGVGSEANVTLNGFSGRHVKIFLDGVPLEGSGSALSINNIPVNFADRIEVYKGVVPVELGADALGGAINIITKNTSNTFVDASYSYGSFNTHRSNLSLGHTTRNGLTFQLMAYQNYSDNNYRVRTQLLDLDNYVYSQEKYWFRRFHDTYHNEAVVAKVGVRDKPWASRLMLEMTYSQEYDEIQNGNLMKVVFGGKERTANSLIPAVNYELRDILTPGLNLSLSARYNHVKTESLDTLARQYNWAGEWKTKSSKGEGTYTRAQNNNDNFYATGNLNYRLADNHFMAFNHVYNTYSRKNRDSAAAADNSTEASFMKRTSTKNVTGLSYKFDHNGVWNVSAFGKYYDVRVTGPINVSTTTTASYEQQNRSYGTLGYGMASTYVLAPPLRLKLSFEKAYRLPTERELFGDEVLETGDAGLKPESSRNLNFNVTFDHQFDHAHALYFDAGFLYRDTRDYIRRQVEQRYGGAYYTNHGKVRNMGIDFEARYFYKSSFHVGGNISYQDIRNRERYGVNGEELVYFADRMPNQPYLFANVDASYTFVDVLGKSSALTFGYNMQYVHKFYLAWRSEGGDINVPSQFSHDLTVNYSMKNGRYNLAFEARNLTDQMLFDNYSLQKPGRNFTVKFRCYFIQTR